MVIGLVLPTFDLTQLLFLADRDMGVIVCDEWSGCVIVLTAVWHLHASCL